VVVRDLIAGAPRRWTLVWLVTMVICCVAVFLLVYQLGVHTTRGRLLDGAAFRGAVVARSPVTDYVEGVLDVVSVLALMVAATAIVGIALVRHRRGLAVAAMVMIVGANATTQLLKSTVLTRPDLGLQETTPATLNSLPSGHGTVALSVVAALVLVLPAALRPVVAIAGVAYASVTGLATLSAGWHRPSDAVAAFLVVGAWAAGIEALVILLDKPADAGDDEPLVAHQRTARLLAVSASYLLAFGGLLSAVIVGTDLTSEGGASALVPAYLAGGGAIAGTAAAVMAALLVVAHRVAPTSLAPPGPPVRSNRWPWQTRSRHSNVRAPGSV
jgi:membrane-associated phospholipid phosphatase